MKAIIHIGLPKVGSSSIQQFLFLNSEALAKQGFRYQRNVKNRGSQYEYPLAVMAGQDVLLPTKSQRSYYQARTLEEQRNTTEPFIKELAFYPQKWKEPVALFSSEHFMPWINTPEMIASTDQLFCKIFDEVSYIVYFRSPVSAIPSQYSEAVKMNDLSKTLDEFTVQALKSFNLFRTANRWLQVVGSGRLNIRLLEKSAMTGGDLIEDYCHACDIDPTGLKRPPRVNQALSAPAAECLRILNSRIPLSLPEGRRNPMRFHLLDVLMELSRSAPKLALNKAQILNVQTATGNSTEKFRKAFFPHMKKLFTDDKTQQSELTNAQLREKALQLMTELLIRIQLGEIPALSPEKARNAFAKEYVP